ncbi:putative reverse transcriptase domain-containing protein [Tanacetum coccineum]
MDIHLPPPPLPFPATKVPTWQSHTSQDLVRRPGWIFGEIGRLRCLEGKELLGQVLGHSLRKSGLRFETTKPKRRAQSRITNCDVVTRKGPITLKLYRVDGTDEVLPNFKANDLHLGEWRKVVKACPNRTGKGWTTIYEQIQARMDYMHKTEHESTKKFKSSIQYEDHPAGTMLNDPILDSEIASQFGKLEYEENLINSIYEAEKSKSLVSATPLSTAFFSTSILKSKRFFKKSTQRFSSTKETNQTECHKCGKKGHFASFCWSKTLVPSYESPFQPKLLYSSEHKPEPRQTKDFEAKYNKVKANLALLSSSDSAPYSSSGKNKGLIAETYDWDEAEVSSDENEVTEKALMEITNEERIYVSKESASNDEWVKVSIQKLLVVNEAKLDLLTMQHVNTEILKENQNLRNELKKLTSMKILGIDQHTEDTSSSRPKDLVFIKSSADNSVVSITSSNKPKLSKTEDSTNHSTVVSDSSTTDYDSTDESSVCFTIIEPSSAPARGNKSPLVSTTISAPAGKLKNVKIEDDPPLAIVMKELNELKLQISKNKSSYFINKNSQQDKTRGEALKAKKLRSFKASKTKIIKVAQDQKTPTKKIKQSERGISINKEKDVNDLLRKYDKIGSSVNTPIMALTC